MNRLDRWRDDLLAGLTGAVAGAPQAMGFALIAGVSPVYGLYAAFVSTVIGTLTSSSTLMTIAPTNALALVVFSALEDNGYVSIEKMAVVALLVGAFQVAFGVLRLGNLTRFVSNSVMTGFITGASLLIILGQLSHVSGYNPQATAGWTEQLSSTLPRFYDWLMHLPESQPHTLIIGMAAIFIIAGLHHTRLKNVATLVAILITSIFILAVGWSDVAIVEHVPQGLPSPMVPQFQYIPELLTDALAIAVLALVQSAALTQTVREPDGTVANTNRDFVAQGLANLAGSLFQCLPTGGSLSRTAVNINAGARTRLANLIAGLSIGLILLVLGPAVEHIALAALAGHLIVAAVSLFDWKAARLVWEVDVKSRTILVVTFVSTLVLPLEFSIYLGVGLSLLFYMFSSMSHLHMVHLVPTTDGHFRAEAVPTKLPDAEPVILSVSGNLFHASVKRLEELLPSSEGVFCPIVILRLRDHENLGSTGVRVLMRYSERLKAQGGRLYLTGIHPHVKAELVRTGTLQKFGVNCIFEATPTIFGATEQALCSAQVWLTNHYNHDAA